MSQTPQPVYIVPKRKPGKSPVYTPNDSRYDPLVLKKNKHGKPKSIPPTKPSQKISSGQVVDNIIRKTPRWSVPPAKPII